VKRLAVRVIPLVAAVSALGGCGSDSKPSLDSVVLSVSADFKATAADQMGFVYTVSVEQVVGPYQNACPALAPSLVITAGDQTLPLNLDKFNCLNTTLTTSPILQPSTFTVTAEQDGKMIAQAPYDGLTPGAAASLASPANGMVHAGDDVVVAPPPQLPSSAVGFGLIIPLEGDPWPGGQYTVGIPDRRPDGVHTQMPVFSGRAALILRGSPFDPDVMISCKGFDVCYGTASNLLGPVYVTETM
jgi:hypothetical protein